jgi:hypothetical protein
VGEEASSAGYGWEVGKRLYLCHGRKAAVYMQYEEKQIKMWGSIMRRAGYRAKAGKQDMDAFEGRLRAEGTRNEAERPEDERGGVEAGITTMLRLSGVLLLCVQGEEWVQWWMRRSHRLATARRWSY